MQRRRGHHYQLFSQSQLVDKMFGSTQFIDTP
jgi:hypothetical protein